jgi:hypothetical protein
MSHDRLLSLLGALGKLLLDEEGGADCSSFAYESSRGTDAAELTQQQLLQQLLLVRSWPAQSCSSLRHNNSHTTINHL